MSSTCTEQDVGLDFSLSPIITPNPSLLMSTVSAFHLSNASLPSPPASDGAQV